MAASFPIFMPDVPTAGSVLIIRLNAILSLGHSPSLRGQGSLRVEGRIVEQHEVGFGEGLSF
jgi:hypothetical protein